MACRRVPDRYIFAGALPVSSKFLTRQERIRKAVPEHRPAELRAMCVVPKPGFPTMLKHYATNASKTRNSYGTIALMKFAPFGVPTPVTLSQPGPVVNELSRPKPMAYQRVDVP